MDIIETSLMTGIDLYFKNKKKSNSNIHFIQSNDIESDIILTHRTLSHYRFLIQDLLIKKTHRMNRTIHTKYTLRDYISFDYFYIFFNESICVYFFGKERKDYIFFDGLHKITDFKNMNLIKWIQHKKIIEMDVFMKSGRLIRLNDCYMTPIVNDHIFNIFLFIQHKYYKKEDIIPIVLEGYSLGGLYLQLFIQLLEEKNLLQKYHIQAYHIESWFQGSEEEYEIFKKKVNIKNIMKYGSYFHLINSTLQKYRKIDSFIPLSKETKSILKSDMPFRFIEYGIASHML